MNEGDLRANLIETSRAIAIILLCSLLVALALGVIWCIVDWLRYYGSGIKLFPFLEPTTGGEAPIHIYTSGTIFGAIEEVLIQYNALARGAARFGTGMGLIAGAFLGLCLAPRRSTVARIVSGVLCGAIVGGRLLIMLSSSPRLLLLGAVTGAVIVTAVTTISAREKIDSLPESG
jgi:hypothetical protein